MKNFLFNLFFVLIGTMAFAQADICNVEFDIGTKNAAFDNDESVNMTFDYVVDEPGGVRIFARPFTNGALTPGYGASGSPIYSGSGTGTANFNISSGTVVVDEIRFQILNADQSELLREFWVPVEYRYGEIGVNNFSFSHDEKLASLLLDEHFDITFNYDVNVAGGARIFIRPMTNGGTTPGYAASGSPLFTGSGSQAVFFTITTGKNIHVDHLRVTVVNDDQSETYMTFYIPVNLYFSTVKVDNIVTAGGNFPLNGADRTVEFDYETTEAAGVRIFPRPWTNGSLTPDYGACGSAVYTGNGSGSCNFTINSGNQRVDHIRFQVVNPDQTEVLLEILSSVEYTFGDFLIENIQLCPPSAVRMLPGEQVHINYGLYNDEGVNTRIFVRPFTEGNLSPGYAASGSPSYGTGSGTASDFFTINNEGVKVDQIRFLITNDDQSETLAEYFIPVEYYFGSPVMTGIDDLTVAAGLEKMEVYPNPAADKFEVNFQLEEAQEVTLSLKDAMGRELIHQNKGKMLSGIEQKITVDASSLLPGLYFVELRGDGFRKTKRLVVAL
jgi:hypothetical protein